MSEIHKPEHKTTLKRAHRQRPVPELDAADQMRILNSIRALDQPHRADQGQLSDNLFPLPLVWRFASVSALSAVAFVVWLSLSGTSIDQLIAQLLINDPLISDLLAL